MFRRGGIDDICALLVSVAHEQVGPPSPTGGSGSLASSALLPSLTAPGQMLDGSLQASSLDTEATEQLSGWPTLSESKTNMLDQVLIADRKRKVEKSKVYAVRHHNGSLCTQRQPEILLILYVPFCMRWHSSKASESLAKCLLLTLLGSILLAVA